MRGLFAEAEAELSACNGDVTRSALHVVVIDEIDAVFRRRSAGEDSGEQTRVSFDLNLRSVFSSLFVASLDHYHF